MRSSLEPAYVLHGRPYRESSVLLEAFSRNHGRVGLVARGAGPKLLALFQQAQARKVDLSDNWNAAGILTALGDAQHKPALAVARAALNHADAAVRSAAVLAVFRIGGEAELETVFGFSRRARGSK